MSVGKKKQKNLYILRGGKEERSIQKMIERF